MRDALGDAANLEEYRSRRDALIARRQGIPANAGWPWPWKDSHTTDVVVTYGDGRLWVLDGLHWVSCGDPEQRVVARLPDMLAAQLATPAGRVALQFRGSVESMPSQPEDVALALLIEAVSRFLRVAMHLEKTSAGYRTTESEGRMLDKLLFFQHDLKRCDADLQAVLLSRAASRPDGMDFQFLGWVRDHAGVVWSGRSEVVEVADDTPFLYGLPLPRSMDEHRPKQMSLTTYDGIAGRRLQHGFELLDALMPAFSQVRAMAVAAEVAALGTYRFGGATPHAWLEQPREALSGRTVLEACRTEDGYHACRRLLQAMWLG